MPGGYVVRDANGQGLHEGDVSGDVLARESDYCHLMIPMYFDPLRYPASADGEATDRSTGL
jgi:hypothetical protein